MTNQDAILASAQAGDPAAFEFVVETILEYLLETDYERAVTFLREQQDRIGAECRQTEKIKEFWDKVRSRKPARSTPRWLYN
jgi:hypothetical protein